MGRKAAHRTYMDTQYYYYNVTFPKMSF